MGQRAQRSALSPSAYPPCRASSSFTHRREDFPRPFSLAIFSRDAVCEVAAAAGRLQQPAWRGSGAASPTLRRLRSRRAPPGAPRPPPPMRTARTRPRRHGGMEPKPATVSSGVQVDPARAQADGAGRAACHAHVRPPRPEQFADDNVCLRLVEVGPNCNLLDPTLTQRALFFYNHASGR